MAPSIRHPLLLLSLFFFEALSLSLPSHGPSSHVLGHGDPSHAPTTLQNITKARNASPLTLPMRTLTQMAEARTDTPLNLETVLDERPPLSLASEVRLIDAMSEMELDPTKQLPLTLRFVSKTHSSSVPPPRKATSTLPSQPPPKGSCTPRRALALSPSLPSLTTSKDTWTT